MGTTEADARDGFGDSADNAPGPSPELVRRNASFALEELTSRYRVVEDLHRVYRSVPFAKIGSKLCAFDPNRDRYMNVLPYEHSAVKLSGGRRGDYINACAVQSGPRDLATFSYVATQGPLEGTIDDFWRMVLEQDVAAVVMLCDLVEDMMPKCAKYFPLEVGEAFETESFEVAATSKDVPFPGVERRALRVSEKRGTATAAVDHLRYSDWPDHGVPDHCESMVRVSRLIRGRYPRSRVAVHCSAGIGRTGTFCMIDVALRRVLGSGEELRGRSTPRPWTWRAFSRSSGRAGRGWSRRSTSSCSPTERSRRSSGRTAGRSVCVRARRRQTHLQHFFVKQKRYKGDRTHNAVNDFGGQVDLFFLPAGPPRRFPGASRGASARWLLARAPALHVLLVHFIVSFEISLGWRKIRKILRRRRSRISIWIW